MGNIGNFVTHSFLKNKWVCAQMAKRLPTKKLEEVLIQVTQWRFESFQTHIQ